MNEQFTPEEFNSWAADYDRSVTTCSGFPFDGYSQVLQTVVDQVALSPGSLVLDLGCGTGNLAGLLAGQGCDLWCLDFSADMLALAQAKLPGAMFCQADIRGEWQPAFRRRFDGIVSAYTFHHFLLEEKVSLVQRLLVDHLNPGGKIVIGDIAFASAADEDQVRRSQPDAWDEEYYWLADEALAAMSAAGMDARFTPVSYCAGVFTVCLF